MTHVQPALQPRPQNACKSRHREPSAGAYDAVACDVGRYVRCEKQHYVSNLFAAACSPQGSTVMLRAGGMDILARQIPFRIAAIGFNSPYADQVGADAVRSEIDRHRFDK